ncbi:unnamed protein product [Gongylonema pulchrum]|uniref:MADF domain-containing protein n=1 Tax=Gongylonema pulchrum TaxID=637853 RepID=A0A183CUG5_9BILA|nr:unnamed protein product [Gongylonema pulchrum]
MAMFGMDNDKKAMLIREVHRRPLIWKLRQFFQVSDPYYSNVPARWVAFEEIADVLSDDKLAFSSTVFAHLTTHFFAGDMIKVAWKNMMDYYNQIRRRHDRALAAGISPPESKWQFFTMMHFTRQDKTPVKRRYNWMQPSKIPRPAASLVVEDDKFLIQMRNNYEATAAAASTVIPKMEESHQQIIGGIRRTKESESKSFRVRLKAKREALRDANITQQAASPVANGTFCGIRIGNKILFNRMRAAATRAAEQAAVKTGRCSPEAIDIKPCILSTRCRNKRRRDIYSPEPNGVAVPSKSRRELPGIQPVGNLPRKSAGTQKALVAENGRWKIRPDDDAHTILTFGKFGRFLGVLLE